MVSNTRFKVIDLPKTSFSFSFGRLDFSIGCLRFGSSFRRPRCISVGCWTRAHHILDHRKVEIKICLVFGAACFDPLLCYAGGHTILVVPPMLFNGRANFIIYGIELRSGFIFYPLHDRIGKSVQKNYTWVFSFHKMSYYFITSLTTHTWHSIFVNEPSQREKCGDSLSLLCGKSWGWGWGWGWGAWKLQS